MNFSFSPVPPVRSGYLRLVGGWEVGRHFHRMNLIPEEKDEKLLCMITSNKISNK